MEASAGIAATAQAGDHALRQSLPFTRATKMDDARLRAVDTVWCRLLCVLERLEVKRNEQAQRTTLCHDAHPDQKDPKESQDELLTEFALQLLAFEKSIGSEISVKQAFWRDFALWVAGRPIVEQSVVDTLARDVAKSLVNLPLKLEAISSEHAERKDDLKTSAPRSLGGNIGITFGAIPHPHVRGGRYQAEAWFTHIDQEVAAPFLQVLRNDPRGSNEVATETLR